jgi:hypothetical protein
MPLNRGPHLPVRQPGPQRPPVAGEGDRGGDADPWETWSGSEHDFDRPAPWDDDPSWREEPTGQTPPVHVPRQANGRNRPGAFAAETATTTGAIPAVGPMTGSIPAVDVTTDLLQDAPPRSGAPQAPVRPGPPAPPGTDRPRRRKRWWLAVVAAVAVLLGASAAVIANRDDPDNTAVPQGGSSGVGQPGGQPSATPSGVSGLGPNPSPAATLKPDAGFQPFPAPRKTLPGASLHLRGGESFGDALRRSDSTYGPLRMVRVFYPGLPPSWNGSRADVANRTVVVSFKAPPQQVIAGRHDSRLASWFASVPKNVDVYWAYFHEPENDVQSGSFTPAQFAAAFKRISGLADRAKNPRLRATLILMCWTLNPNSRRDFNDYYPGSAAVDVLGWDCYNSGTKNRRYTPPQEVFSRMISKSRALGKPWGLAETGTAKIAGDSSGTGRAEWLRSMSRYLNEQKPLWVAYYDYQVSGGDFRLLDKPSQDAWRAWCAASPA